MELAAARTDGQFQTYYHVNILQKNFLIQYKVITKNCSSSLRYDGSESQAYKRSSRRRGNFSILLRTGYYFTVNYPVKKLQSMGLFL